MSYTRTRRSDTGSVDLIKVARKLGFKYQAQDGTLDGLLWKPNGRIWVVDWKARANAPRTKAQERLVSEGLDVQFVWSVDQLLALVQR